MPTLSFLQSLVELATCDSTDVLLVQAVSLLERELGMRARIELWDEHALFARGEAQAAHVEWIGVTQTLGAIYLEGAPAERVVVELMAMQLAPLVERLVEVELSRRLTIREDIERLYERRIRDALGRHDWNASAVARELAVGRGRIARVVRRWAKNERRDSELQPGLTRCANDASTGL